MTRILLVLFSISFLFSCSLFDKEKTVEPTQTVKIDSTWAKSIVTGKTFPVTIGPKDYELEGCLQIHIEPNNYLAKTINITPIIDKQKLIAYFKDIEKKFPNRNGVGMSIGIRYKNKGSENTIYERLSVQFSSNNRPGFFDVNINTLPDKVFFIGLPDPNIGQLNKSDSFVTFINKEFQIFGVLGVGTAPDYLRLGNYFYDFDTGLK